jgi:hypothetical protein
MLSNIFFVLLLPILILLISLLFSMLTVRILDLRTHLSKIFLISLLHFPILIYLIVFYKTEYTIPLTVILLLATINYFLLLLCYISFHSGIEIASPSMFVLLQTDMKKSLNYNEAKDIINSISINRISRLEFSFLTNKQRNGLQLSKLGKLVFFVLTKLDEL